MKRIFVQIKCDPGESYKVAEKIMDEVDEVGELHSTSGQFDLLCKFHLDDKQDVGRFVTERIQTFPGIKDTFTIITFKAF